MAMQGMQSKLRDILIVASPIIVLGVVGNVVGLSMLAGGAIINLGYVLAFILALSSSVKVAVGAKSGWRNQQVG